MLGAVEQEAAVSRGQRQLPAAPEPLLPQRQVLRRARREGPHRTCIHLRTLPARVRLVLISFHAIHLEAVVSYIVSPAAAMSPGALFMYTEVIVLPALYCPSRLGGRYAGDGLRCFPCAPEVSALLPTFSGGSLARGAEGTIFGASSGGWRCRRCGVWHTSSALGVSVVRRVATDVCASLCTPPARAASVTTPARPRGPSDFACNTSDLARSLRWTGVLAGAASSPVNLSDSTNYANTNSLVIAPRSLPVGRTAVFTFTACYADAPPDPKLCGTASSSLTVTSTPLVATLSGVNAIVGAGTHSPLPTSRTDGSIPKYGVFAARPSHHLSRRLCRGEPNPG